MATVREATGWGMADVVFEAVGHQTDTLATCFNLVRHGGTLVAFGVPDDHLYHGFPYSQFFRQNITLIGSVGPDVLPTYTLARDLIAQGRFDVSPLVTHVLPFQEVQRAWELFADREDGALKVVLDYDSIRAERP